MAKSPNKERSDTNSKTKYKSDRREMNKTNLRTTATITTIITIKHLN